MTERCRALLYLTGLAALLAVGAVAAAAGYDWADSNTRQATQRTRPDGTPRPPLGRLDWFFTRGLTVADPLTVPAIDKDGMAISDHDLLQVKISVNSATPHA